MISKNALKALLKILQTLDEQAMWMNLKQLLQIVYMVVVLWIRKEKHVTTSFCDLQKVSKKINYPHFKDLEELDDNRFEVTASKHKLLWILLYKLAVLYIN